MPVTFDVMTLMWWNFSMVSVDGTWNMHYNDVITGANHQLHDCLLNGLFRRRSKKTWKLRVTGLCAGNSPVTVEFPAQMASNADVFSIWSRHHGSIALGWTDNYLVISNKKQWINAASTNKSDLQILILYKRKTFISYSIDAEKYSANKVYVLT